MFALMLLLLAPTLVMAGVSAVYFLADPRRPAYAQRLLVSAHGVVGVVLYATAFLVGPLHTPAFRLYWAWLLLCLVPPVLIGVAVFTFRGNKLVHILQVPNIAALLWVVVVGGTAFSCVCAA